MIYDKIKNNKAVIIIFLVLILITFLTQFYGSTDISDYSDVAKFFAGKYPAKIRSSHSYLLGFLHSPFVILTDNYIIFKITSLIFLALIVYSVYLLSNRNRKALWLMLLSPVIWYMGPWTSPLQLASLLFLWAYYFIEKYDYTNKLKYLVYSGIFVGLSWAVWDTIFYFGFILAFVFLFNKKLSHSICFILFLLIGLMPRLILDQFLFNFPFYSMIKNTFGGFATSFGGIYENILGNGIIGFFNIFPTLLSIPLYFWIFYSLSLFRKNKKQVIFLSLCLALILLVVPQIRYLLALAPIMILLISREINQKQFQRQIVFSIIVILLFITPYLIQINYSMADKLNGAEFMYVFENFQDIKLNKEFPEEILIRDLQKIVEEYPNQTFVVGNAPDSYQMLAHIYWGKDIQELVSIQDYNLVLNNEDMTYNPEKGYEFSEASDNLVIYEKIFMPSPNIAERRQIWLAGGINKNANDGTDYKSIELGIGIDEPINLENFAVIEKYDGLYLSKKIES